MSDPRTSAPCAGCGHGRGAHEHYRRGSDCGLCGCRAFVDRRSAGSARWSGTAGGLLSALSRRLHRPG